MLASARSDRGRRQVGIRTADGPFSGDDVPALRQLGATANTGEGTHRNPRLRLRQWPDRVVPNLRNQRALNEESCNQYSIPRSIYRSPTGLPRRGRERAPMKKGKVRFHVVLARDRACSLMPGSACHAAGRGFESRPLRHLNQRLVASLAPPSGACPTARLMSR